MKKTALITSVILFFSLMMGSFSADAQSPLVMIGKKKVNYGPDYDEMIVTSIRGDFKAIKIRVTKAAVNMHRCVIVFGNGTKQEVELRKNFAPGSESRVIDLNGHDRVIKKIKFWYDTKNRSRKRGTVTVFAKP